MRGVAGRSLLLSILAAACSGDPSVRVSFEVPEAYRDLVDTVGLEVLAPDDGEIDCDTVALGNASEQELAGARVAEALVREEGDGAPLSGVPRTGRKLFVARAFSESAQLVAAGCAEAGTIGEDEEVVIEGEPALTLGARDAPSSGPLPGEITVLVSDAHGQPVEGVVAEQTVYAANETELPGEPSTSGRGGALRLSIEQADWAGPQVLDVDVRWQANQRDLFSGFATPFLRDTAPVPDAAEPEDLPTSALYQIGAIGPDGEMGVAVLGRADDGSMRRVYIYLYQGGSFGAPTTSDLAMGVETIGLVETEQGDRIVAMNRTTWYSIDPDGSVHEDGKPGLMDAAALAPIGACSGTGLRDRILAVSTTGEIGIYDPLGTRVDEEWTGNLFARVGGLLAAGCVRSQEDSFRAAVFTVAGEGSERPVLALDAPGAEPTPVNSAVDRGFAFTPFLPGADGPFLLANRFENDGNSIARYTAIPVDGAPTFLDQRDEDEIAGVATTTAGGDFDRDGRLDVAAMATVPLGDGRVELRFYMALGFVVEEQRLFGLDATEILASPDARPLLLAADFDGDGIDDLFLASTQAFSLFELEPE